MKKWSDVDRQQTVLTKDELSVVDALSFLEAQRIKKGISQTQMAQKIGMTQPQLAKIENLDSMPTFATLSRYAEGLGLQISLSIRPLGSH